MQRAYPMTKPPENVPKALDAMIDIVLAYKPKPKSNPAKKRKRKAQRVAKTVRVEKSAQIECTSPRILMNSKISYRYVYATIVAFT
jgi:hypothetical protein